MKHDILLLGIVLFLSDIRSSPSCYALVRDCFPNATTGKTVQGCYSSLWDVAVALEEKNPFQPQTFILCPNTEYRIGDRDSSQPDCFRDGDTTIQLRQFSKILCGENGSSQNNCTIRGGFSQMVTTMGSYNLEQKTRIVVEGITFAQGRGASLFLAAGGDIVFRDCVFKDHINDGTIKIVFQALNVEDGDDRRRRRYLQQKIKSFSQVDVTFDRCVFQSNRYPGGLPVGLRQLGVINMQSSAGILNITNSVFIDNEFLIEYELDTYLVNVATGNVLNMQNNCFLSNTLQGKGLVHLANSSSLGDIRQNAGSNRNSSTLDCDFLHVDGPNSSLCLGFDQEEACPLNNIPMVSSRTFETGEECTAKDCTSSSMSLSLHGLLLLLIAIIILQGEILYTKEYNR